MFRLFNNDTDEEIGRITEEQLQFLIDNLEEEDIEDTDYYIDRDTLLFLEEIGCDSDLLGMLKESMGEEKGIEIRYEKG